ncbi:MAG: response regulator [Gammaproteobacteria bacterium]|nr:response regulator [Gammaproteobacteria bacterium]
MMNNAVKILVIEDVNFSRQALVSMLTRFNCEVESASNGYDAIAKVAENHYDLILTDIALNDMEGMTVAETVRNIPAQNAANVPIVALTSYGDDFLKKQALSSGMNDFLMKPLTFDSALALLKKWTGKH